MEKVNRIIFDDEYRLHLLKNKEEEEQRLFCRHDLEHLVTVARLTYLLLLEKGCRFISKEIAYSAGLLHDIGRWKEYQSGGDHARHSAALSEPILKRAGFVPQERNLIVKAIAQHRYHDPDKYRSPLSEALYKADELSRLCFNCDAYGDCRRIKKRLHQKKLYY